LYHAERPEAGTDGARPAFDSVIAGGLVGCAMATFYLIAAVVSPGWGMLIGQASLVAIPALAATFFGHKLAVLGISRTRAIFVVAAALVGLTTWYVNWRIVRWVEPPPDGQLDDMTERTSLVGALAMIAVVPPICEEVLFRGVLARALARQLPLAVAVVLSAVFFSAYHLSLARAIPTLVLGLILALIAIRADSIVPTIIGHALNNAVALVVIRGELPAMNRWIENHPTAMLIGCLAASGAGVALVLRSSPR
jgi:membrane protease YdiL (CAAX protease family)